VFLFFLNALYQIRRRTEIKVTPPPIFFCKLIFVNYLAHAYLSFGDPEIVTGNLISDFVKGKKKYDYPRRILAGIDLHRYIDQFTDDHPLNKEVSRVFKPDYGKYSTAFMDVVYDHFLAMELVKGGPDEFEEFTQQVYRQIETFREILPLTFNNIFPYMKQHNWLFNYQFSWGIEKSMEGLVHRAAYISQSESAFRIFNEHYDEFQKAYDSFFPELRSFSLKKFSDIH
jgi:acyl carrier protein phosphodiesterase